MYINVEPRRPVVFIEGWLQYWSEDKEWKSLWCVLKDETIYFYNSHRASNDSLEGTIALGPESRLEKITEDGRSGFMFKLHTKRSVNTFIAPKFTEREHWKACVEGIARGRLSDDIDLLPGQIVEITTLLQQFLRSKSQSTSVSTSVSTSDSDYVLQDSFGPADSSTSGCFMSRKDKPGYVPPTIKPKPITIPKQKYKFYSDPSRTNTPSWFFSDCSRDQANKILTVGAAYGNTLMRDSTSGRNNLVISKRMESSSNGQEFTHYILQWTTQGYKIEVENYHEPMQSLSEVMDFFIATSGKSSTRPMKTNDLQILGIEVHNDYNKRIVSSHPDPDSGEEVDADVLTDSSYMDERDVPAPLAAPVTCKIKNNVQQQPKSDSQPDSWRTRAVSVPNISGKDLEYIQSSRWAEASNGTLNKSSTMRVNAGAKRDGLFQSFKPNDISTMTLPPIPKVKPPLPLRDVPPLPLRDVPPLPLRDVPPPLPPNHPPPKKSLSQSDFKLDDLSANVKKGAFKHTQSMSSADIYIRKTSPRDTHSASIAKDELASVVARIKQHKEEPAAEQFYTEPESHLNTPIKSPTVATENFKRKLEGLIGNQNTPGLIQNTPGLNQNTPGLKQNTPGLKPNIPHLKTSPSDNSANISHYQNVHEILNSKK